MKEIHTKSFPLLTKIKPKSRSYVKKGFVATGKMLNIIKSEKIHMSLYTYIL